MLVLLTGAGALGGLADRASRQYRLTHSGRVLCDTDWILYLILYSVLYCFSTDERVLGPLQGLTDMLQWRFETLWFFIPEIPLDQYTGHVLEYNKNQPESYVKHEIEKNLSIVLSVIHVSKTELAGCRCEEMSATQNSLIELLPRFDTHSERRLLPAAAEFAAKRSSHEHRSLEKLPTA